MELLRSAFWRSGDKQCKEVPQKILQMLPKEEEWLDATPEGLFSEEDDDDALKKMQRLHPSSPAKKHTKRRQSQQHQTTDSKTAQKADEPKVRIGKAGEGEAGGPISPFPLTRVHEPPPRASKKQKELETYLKSYDLEIGFNKDQGLRRLSWSGVPSHHRSQCWQLLCSYLPLRTDRRSTDIAAKRAQYVSYIQNYYEDRETSSNPEAATILSILVKDIPRTNPKVPLFNTPEIQKCLERMLFIWSLRHPATGYVQGMNDLMVPFVVVFLTPFVGEEVLLSTKEREVKAAVSSLGEHTLLSLEADVYWCFTAFLHHIQDNFTEGQPGIQAKLLIMQEVLEKTDPVLASHLAKHEVSMIQFAYKWINCLLLRELPLPPLLRLWDAYMAEGDDYPMLHMFVCLALLDRFSSHLIHMDFCELIQFLLCPPTSDFTEADADKLLETADAYRERFPNARH